MKKKWYKSKSFVSGLLLILYGILRIAIDKDYQSGIQLILGGMGIVGIRQAIKG